MSWALLGMGILGAVAAAIAWFARDRGAGPEPLPPSGVVRRPEAERVPGCLRTTARPLEGLDDVLRAWADLEAPLLPMEVATTLARLPGGEVVVGFPDGVPVQMLCRLVAWVDDGALQTTGFLTAPDGERFALRPDPDAVAGDRLRGVGSRGARVEVDLTDGAVHPVASARADDGPDPAKAEVVARFVLVVEGTARGNTTFAVTGTPPPVPTAETSRVDAALWALVRDPSPALGTLHRPDEAEMDVPPAELEAHYGGTLRFATTSWHDQWLLHQPEGSWREVQLEDGVLAVYPSAAHLAAELLVRASEEAVDDGALERMARALGLPGEAAAWVREGGAGDYDAWKTALVARVVASTVVA